MDRYEEWLVSKLPDLPKSIRGGAFDASKIGIIGNFLLGAVVYHFPKTFSQVAQIFKNNLAQTIFKRSLHVVF